VDSTFLEWNFTFLEWCTTLWSGYPTIFCVFLHLFCGLLPSESVHLRDVGRYQLKRGGYSLKQDTILQARSAVRVIIKFLKLFANVFLEKIVL